MNDDNAGPPKGPWGKSPQKSPEPKPPGSGMRPPDFETLLKKTWADIRRFVPEGALGKRGAWALAVAAAGVWLALGVFTVNAQEQGVVLRFGAFVKHVGPGTYWHLPWPIETAYTPNVKKPNQLDIGFKPSAEAGGQPEDKQEESYMLTGDDNIVDMQFSVFWRIKDANAYLFNIDRGASDDTVKALAESAMRQVVGEARLNDIMTSHREQIQARVQRLMQATLNSYNAGIEVVSVKMQKAETPSQVKKANNDVQKALADQDKKRTDAESYANSVIPQARGDAARIVEDAQGYKEQAIAQAKGEADRFAAIYQEYKRAPEVTRRRIYLETMTQVLAPMQKVIVDDAARGVNIQIPAAKAASGKPSVSVSESAAPGGAK